MLKEKILERVSEIAIFMDFIKKFTINPAVLHQKK